MLLHKIHGHRERILSLQSTLIKTTGTIRSVGHWSRKSTYLQAIVQVLIYIVCACGLCGTCLVLAKSFTAFVSLFAASFRLISGSRAPNNPEWCPMSPSIGDRKVLSACNED